MLRARLHSAVPSLRTMLTAAPSVLFDVHNAARVVTLNRPAKLNLLNLEMLDAILQRLQQYAGLDAASLVVLRLSLPKAFCAGGDVVALAKACANGHPEEGVRFFQNEYTLNYLLATYPKPVVAYMNGITMGGGVGLSVHVPFRIATETTMFAMPEMDIGLFPDVGTTFFLLRLDGKLGYYYALTGERLIGRDAVAAGVATHYVPLAKLDEVTARLAGLEYSKETFLSPAEFYAVVNQAIGEFAEPFPKDYVFPIGKPERELIARAFSSKTLVEAVAVLEEDGLEFAKKTVATLATKSPLALRAAFDLLNKNSTADIYSALQTELNAAEQCMVDSDFTEGVLAKLVEKRAPKWRNTNIAEVSKEDALRFATRIANSSVEGNGVAPLFGITFTEYPHLFGLPSEREIEEYVTGNDGSGRKYLPTPKEVEKRFGTSAGALWKVRDVLSRRTELYEGEYVKWKL